MGIVIQPTGVYENLYKKLERPVAVVSLSASSFPETPVNDSSSDKKRKNPILTGAAIFAAVLGFVLGLPKMAGFLEGNTKINAFIEKLPSKYLQVTLRFVQSSLMHLGKAVEQFVKKPFQRVMQENFDYKNYHNERSGKLSAAIFSFVRNLNDKRHV